MDAMMYKFVSDTGWGLKHVGGEHSTRIVFSSCEKEMVYALGSMSKTKHQKFA